MSILKNLCRRSSEREFDSRPVNVESDYGGLAVDISGPITPLDSFQFCTEAAANTTFTRVRFGGADGCEAKIPDGAQTEVAEAAATLDNTLAYKWFEIWNAITGRTDTSLPSTVVSITFSPAANVLFHRPGTSTSKRTVATLRAAADKWLAGETYTIGREG